MIRAEKLSYSFPEKELYNKISFTIEEGQHCAFIGASGTGKSTLANIIMEPEQYLYDGKLFIDENCRIGYVSQFVQVDKTQNVTVFEYLSEEFVTLQNQMNAICKEMETAAEFEELMEQYQVVLDAFNAIDGDNYENNITKKLNLAELSKQKDMPVSSLSGGEFKLIQVIKEMLPVPDLLIMDEPDVFLDFGHLNALMNLINFHKGTLLVITHNRFLLDHCFNKILHLENKEMQEFDGRYLDYSFSLLQMKIEKQELAAADTEEIERNEKLVEQLRKEAAIFTSATRGRALHARVSFLERLKAKRIKEPFVEIKQPEIQFSAGGEIEEGNVLEVKDYSISFDEILLEHVTFEIGAKDKVALIGPNGSGKTTLLRDIYKHAIESIIIRENTKAGFVSQLQGEMLNEANTILDEFLDMGFAANQDVQKHLEKFGFEEEELYQRIRQLSGGEKNLLQLAKLSAGEQQLLILDEPTSHLDTYSQAALEKAINEYDGAVLMVSHDFYTIANCMDYVLLIEDKNVRRMSIRKFRKMIYANHFNKDYLEIEQKKKNVEMKIELALKKRDYESAKVLAEDLEKIVKQM
ncbi:ABC-F family ATP-binding cassette domain-containing protein [[Clostridium] polysaccharolyticum]|jgi:ATP-binding cassette subfamily F protein 3|uniref:ATP-binding cassette, subfamily F, member 3 n=1 Tax=[Clostridium] polysaccharolyticum TaxID=29364 RepID=A0A1I0E775_9FIRM|nr:ABC-F family ATP-binding cassette domain-containing protein [[Clostridium] polysaccharolyticum]SET40986.1 ATP-binding cassette, subfamily F, member 3 [[Clostridium] polysaccharolyticum]